MKRKRVQTGTDYLKNVVANWLTFGNSHKKLIRSICEVIGENEFLKMQVKHLQTQVKNLSK